MIERQVGNVLVTVKFDKVAEVETFGGKKDYANKYIVKCKNLDTGIRITFPFTDSIRNYYDKDIEHDELIDSILECIREDFYLDIKMFPTFEDFANEFGYDLDSRKAEKVYHEVIKQAAKLQSVFTEELVETFYRNILRYSR